MKVVIPGRTGQDGSMLARALHSGGHDVVVISRRPVAAPWRTVQWDARHAGPWAAELEGTDDGGRGRIVRRPARTPAITHAATAHPPCFGRA